MSLGLTYDAQIAIVQFDDGTWHVAVEYSDGDKFIHRKDYDTEEQATAAAWRIATILSAPEGSC